MDEAKMTDADMKQREKIVKSMKKNFKDFRKRYGERAKEVMYATATKMAMKESHYPTQGSSVEYPKYKEMDMENLVQDAIKEIPEDDGPHTSDIGDMDAANFQTVAKPEDVVNQPNNEGNRESTAVVASRKTGKPFKAIRSRGPKSYGPEDLSGAVASVAIGEEVEEADRGEYDYEGDMAKSSLKTIIRNAQLMHDMLGEDTNLPEWVQGKITLAEDYIVSAAQYMQSEMKEEVEQVDEISKELAWKAANKSLEKTRVAAYGSIYGGEAGHKRFQKAVRQQKKISDYASAKTPKVPYVNEEEELEEGEVKKANKASKNEYMKKLGKGSVERGRLANKGKQKPDTYKHKTSNDRLAAMDHAERKIRLDSYGKNQDDRMKKVAWDNLPPRLKKIGSDFRPGDIAKAKAAGKLPLKKKTNEETIDELKHSTVSSAVMKRAERLVDVERDASLSPQNKKILAAYHKKKLARNAKHQLVHDMPNLRKMMYKKTNQE